MKFHIHEWGKWSLPMDTANCYKKVQTRCCKSCNKAEVQQIKQPWNVWFIAAKMIEAMKGTP